MSFKIFSTDDGRVPPTILLPAAAVVPVAGLAFVQSGGNLTIAAGSDKPVYISVHERAEAMTAGELLPVIRVYSDIVFETTNSAELTGVELGDKLTLDASGLEVTATTGGSAELVAFDDTAIGSRVLVRFN